VSGYAHPSYAESLGEFGSPLELRRCGGWLLKRKIPVSPYFDTMGCYPIFACQDWSQLSEDLEDIADELVSLSAVPDPFGTYSETDLNRSFRDVVRPFKQHFIVDLSRPMEDIASSHHRQYARKASLKIVVEKCENPSQFIKEWVDLYAALVRRHGIKGIPAFSELSFSKQLRVPGIVMFRALERETTVGMKLWYDQGDVGYSHLSACSARGYQIHASYALMWHSIEHFATRSKLRWLDLGGGAGVDTSRVDGVGLFKQGWSTETRTVYFCGRIFNHEKYEEVVKAKGVHQTQYFPAYRKGEFA
jgi:hypothetical protein